MTVLVNKMNVFRTNIHFGLCTTSPDHVSANLKSCRFQFFSEFSAVGEGRTGGEEGGREEMAGVTKGRVGPGVRCWRRPTGRALVLHGDRPLEG